MRIAVGILLQLTVAGTAAAQSPAVDLAAVASMLTSERPVPPAVAAFVRSWTEPTPPFRIVGPIYYVGTRGLAAYLITTPAGHILLDGALPASAGDVEASIRSLGFNPEDIRLLLITHAHIEHAGTVAHFKKLSRGTVAVMGGDAEVLASGGRTDFRYAREPALHFPRVTPDRVLEDGESLAVGGIRMTARLGAGQTRGATTWITTVEEGGRSYDVVFPCCTAVNAGYRLVSEPSYPGIADDYRRTFRMLESLEPDIWLGSHTQFFGFEEKRSLTDGQAAWAWVDPDGYRRFLAAEKANFEELVDSERQAAPPLVRPRIRLAPPRRR
jgi:metallo-beta-lactamase class B